MFSTFCWISSLLNFTKSILTGSPLIISNNFTTEKFLKLVEKQKVWNNKTFKLKKIYIIYIFFQINYTFLIPIQINNLLAYPDIAKYDLSSLKYCTVGGTFIGEEKLKAFQKLLPHCFVMNRYGLTETHGGVTMFSIPEDIPLMKKKISSVGKPMQGCSFKVNTISYFTIFTI